MVERCIKCYNLPNENDYLIHKLCRKCYRKNYHLENKEFENINNKIWRINNPEFFDSWRSNNEARIKILNRNGYLNSRSKRINDAKIWSINNPKKRLEIDKRRMLKLSIENNIPYSKYRYSLISWSKSIKTRDNNECQICGNKADVSHHIFYKNRYPQLSLNLNNGIALCKEHHGEIHMLNGVK